MTLALPCHAIRKNTLRLLQLIHQYPATIDTVLIEPQESYAYARATLNVERRNPTLLLVPSVFVIAHGKEREYFSEAYSKVTMAGFSDVRVEPLLRLTTIPHRRHPMSHLLKFLAPNLYGETIIGNTLLSPFHPNNFRFYTYRIFATSGGRTGIRFKPKRHNTQLVAGDAFIDPISGRIITCHLKGDYDLVRFHLTIEMGQEGIHSLLPDRSTALCRFQLLGNKVVAHYEGRYNLPKVITDSITDDNDAALMALVRPDSLTAEEQAICAKMEAKQLADSIQAAQGGKKRSSWAKRVFWDAFGDNVLNRVNSHFGVNNKGYVRLNPVLNPLYMGYDRHRGFTYKFDLRASYQFTDNSEFTARFKAGYAFKQEQFYFRLPLYYYFNKRRNGYVKFEVGNGNHIRSTAVSRDIAAQQEGQVSTDLINLEIFNEFKQSDARLIVNYDFNEHFGLQLGALYQRKRAVNRYAFHTLGWESTYSSFAPVIQLQFRPWGWSGPIFTADYDHGFKGALKTNIGYERWEFNGEYIRRINQLQSLQMRAGLGFYTHKGRNAYFLNYENFTENNIPGGWNDDWSGEFELLRGDTYNNSNYYVRANLTYESPLLLLSWLPWVGRYMEMERIYASILDAKQTHPYVELGYGFTTRLLSLGFFVSNGLGNRTVGVKFGFELFRHW